MRRVRVRDERGSVIAFTAVAFPVLLLLVSFVIDMANFWVHDRHLQTQADAAALAAALDLRYPCDSSVQGAAQTTATRFSGDTTTSVNRQIGNTPADPTTEDPDRHVQMRLNSVRWPGQDGAGEQVDEELQQMITQAGSATVCALKAIDVKLTEFNLPTWVPLVGQFRELWDSDVDVINAHARVELRKASGEGVLPMGLPVLNPRAVWIELRDDDAGGPLTPPVRVKLKNTGSDSEGRAIWTTETPVPTVIDRANVGVRAIVVDKGDSADCTASGVNCYDSAAGAPFGISHIRGWTLADTGASGHNRVRVREVEMLDTATPRCGGNYFVPAGDDCRLRIDADLDFHTNVDLDRVQVRVKGAPATKTLQRVGSIATGYRWVSTDDPDTWFTVESTAGSQPVDLQWRITNASGSGGSWDDLGDIHRVYRAGEASGPVEMLDVGESPGILSGANSFARGALRNLTFTVKLSGQARVATSADAPQVIFRFGSASGSQNQSLQCEASTNLRDELVSGCPATYQPRTVTPCETLTTTVALRLPEPRQCVVVRPGGATNQPARGLNQRILGDADATRCPAAGQPGYNNWNRFPNIERDDPRLTTVFIVPGDSFGGEGRDVLPLSGFAGVYITGWGNSGRGAQNPCTGRGDESPPPEIDANTGYVIGHLIKTIYTTRRGVASAEMCSFASADLTPCVAVLTK